MIRMDVQKEIQKKLLEIQEKEKVTILYAAESGSRAWGFASCDSDYDVRFIYVRRKEDYLKLIEEKDVIEWQLDEVFDINGWDLKKALIQFQKGNATLFEWSNSPIVYKTTQEWKDIYRAAESYFSVKAAAYHYYGTANSTCCQYLKGNQVNYKKYFYALRPLLAGRYIELHQCPPPVCFEDLMKLDMPKELRKEANELLEIKKKSRESQNGAPFPAVQAFIESELLRQKDCVNKLPDDRNRDWAPLNEIFLTQI